MELAGCVLKTTYLNIKTDISNRKEAQPQNGTTTKMTPTYLIISMDELEEKNVRKMPTETINLLELYQWRIDVQQHREETLKQFIEVQPSIQMKNLKGCVCYIFTSLFCMPEREDL